MVVLLELFDRKDPSYGDGSAEYFRNRFGKLLERKTPEINEWAASEVKRVAKPDIVDLQPLPPELRAIYRPLIPRGRTEGVFHSREWAQMFQALDKLDWPNLW